MVQTFSGTNNHIVILPNTASIPAGSSFEIKNDSTGIISVKDFLGTTLNLVSPSSVEKFTLLDGLVWSYPLNVGQINYADFNTAYSPTHSDGRIHYDQTDKTLSVDIDSANGVELQVGQEEYIRAVNKTGAPIPNGSVVYISGAQGNRPTIALALGSDALAGKTIGVTTQAISDNAEGMITISGVVGGINTSVFSAGDRLYLSGSVSGGLTATKPSAPNYAIPVAWALNSTSSGKILVDIRSANKVQDINDVTLSSVANGDTLVYANGIWKNNPNWK